MLFSSVDEELCPNGVTEVLRDRGSLMGCIVMMGRLIAQMFSTLSLGGSLILMADL